MQILDVRLVKKTKEVVAAVCDRRDHSKRRS